MIKELIKIFNDDIIIKKIQDKLPKLFHIAELECSRAGKIGMEVGSVREKIITSLLIYKFGENNVETEIPITEAEVDVRLFKKPISIKTITGKSFTGVKLIWTVDADKSKEFKDNYTPTCDMIFVQINWDNGGGFYYITKELQKEIFDKIGKDNYIKLPKPGTNPRGVEMTGNALKKLINNEKCYKISISWSKTINNFKPYQRWIDLWNED
jgi:hypothetical protein